ncbi:MAG TPA: plasmid mobilization relaxosome protein MobC [Cyanobacteria bacterium UBA8543]|nr:plasmid mobilization relaxosome protein MobC [Cyanobacteria bacterium UBA8543]
MPKTPRPHKFQVCLSEQECSMLEAIAQRENMTRSDLLRFKTIYQKLPRRTTKIAAQTYWLLANQTNNINQGIKALNAANSQGLAPKQKVLLDLLSALQNNLELLTQVRKELVELDLLAQLDDIEEESDDWETIEG